MLNRLSADRPDLVDVGGRVTQAERLDEPVDVELDERWSDGSHFIRSGVATHAGHGPDGPVVHCRWQGLFGQIEAWLPLTWTRRTPDNQESSRRPSEERQHHEGCHPGAHDGTTQHLSDVVIAQVHARPAEGDQRR